LQVRVRWRGGEERVYALKAYSDDFGERVWTHAVQLAERLPPRLHRPCLPIHHIPQERVLVFDWVEGRILSKIVDGRKPELLRHAAAVAADLHRVPIVPERPTTPQMLVDETRARCDNLRPVWPGTADMVEPQVSRRNVSFYRALTLLRKTYTVCRRQPAEGPHQAVRLAACARAALEDVRRQ